MITFGDLFEFMKRLDMFDFFFPWLLFTALIYGVLQNRKYISDEASVNGAIALSVAFLISYFGRGMFMANVFWIFSIFILIFLLGSLISALVGVNITDILKEKTWIVYIGIGLAFISVIAALIVTENYGYFGLDKLSFYGLNEIISIIVVIGGLIGIFYLLVKS